MLPEARPSSHIYGQTDAAILEQRSPSLVMLGIKRRCSDDLLQTRYGQNTYGTSCFMLMNTGRWQFRQAWVAYYSAWGVNKVEYALEGSIFITGAAIQWLRDGIKIIDNSAESEAYATEWTIPAVST